jgi:hypothetical protein
MKRGKNEEGGMKRNEAKNEGEEGGKWEIILNNRISFFD